MSSLIEIEDIVRKRGDTAADRFQVKSESTRAPVDITGYSFKLTVNSEEKPANADNQVFQITGSIADAETGLVDFAPSQAQADNTGEYFYEVEITDGSGAIRSSVTKKYDMIQDLAK